MLPCSVSDRNKLLLLKCPDLWTFLVLGLFLDEDHPRGLSAAPPSTPIPIEVQAIYQRNYAETLQQLALFPSGRDALREQAAVMKALEEVAERGLSAEAKEHAEGALMALSDKEMHADADGPKHIMLSYQVRPLSLCSHCSHGSWASALPCLCMQRVQWDSQEMITRIHTSLCRRSYLVWIDTEMMKGSTMDAVRAILLTSCSEFAQVCSRYAPMLFSFCSRFANLLGTDVRGDRGI